METRIKLKARCIKSEEDLGKFERGHLGVQAEEFCHLPENFHGGWRELWKIKHSTELAGISTESVIAIEGLAVCPIDIGLTSTQFSLFTKEFIYQQFSKRNCLSCVGFEKEDVLYCHFLVYPLQGRQLNPDKWIDSHTHGLKFAIADLFVEQLDEAFHLHLQLKGEEHNGHTEYLDNFPQVLTSKEDVQEIFYTTITEDAQAQTDYPKDKIQTITNTTIQYFTTGVERGSFFKLNMGDITVSQYLAEVEAYLTRMYPDMSQRDKDLIVRRVNSAATEFYILNDLINDPRISDIKVMSPDKIRVKVEGSRRTSNLHFINDTDYYRFLEGIITRYGLDPEQEIHVFTDKTTNPDFILRNNITMNHINSGYPGYHIRKIPKKKYTIEQLIDLGVMDKTVANYLVWAAREAKGLVFTGKGSSGKTTMMNTLLEYTPSDASGLVIQESEELFSDKPEMSFEHIIPGYDLKELAKNGLLTDIDYFIIGEVKGEEAMYFINACDTGNKGWCSVHSPSSEEAINKLADYVMYASKYNREEALYMLKELQVVVFMKNFKVAEISEVVGWDDERKMLKFRTVFKRNDL